MCFSMELVIDKNVIYLIRTSLKAYTCIKQSARMCYVDTIFRVVSVCCLMVLLILDEKLNGTAHRILFTFHLLGKDIWIMNALEAKNAFHKTSL